MTKIDLKNRKRKLREKFVILPPKNKNMWILNEIWKTNPGWNFFHKINNKYAAYHKNQ